MDNMNGKFGDPSFDTRMIEEARDELSQLRSLNPPKADEAALHAAFDHWSSALKDLERLARAFEKDDRRGGAKAFRDAAREARAIARLIPSYPVGDCLGQGIG